MAALSIDGPYECRLGNPTLNPPDDNPGDCTCEQSCEPHRHFSWGVECYHDGENDHGHCAQGFGK